tara:strand:+ start:286 stop:594 length:309 start_codon:yes stop_codon:yes gene_type:complete
MDELYYLHYINDLPIDDDIHHKDRDNAIRVLLKAKKVKAKIILNDNDILDDYRAKGMEEIKKKYNRDVCYLYHTDFCYDVLFYHYKNDWEKLEILIKNKLNA